MSAQSDTCFDPNSKAYYRCERNIERICADYLIDDLIELEETLLAVHPDPYAYCGKEAFDEAYKKASEFYSEDRTMIEHAQNLNRFIGVVQDPLRIVMDWRRTVKACNSMAQLHC